MRRVAIASLALGLLVVLASASPVEATGRHHKSAPAIRVHAITNDDGRAGRLDPGDVGGTGPAYDHWGESSSGDPSELGMDPHRFSEDVGRCAAVNLDAGTLRVSIGNAYPGYTCTFVIKATTRVGSRLVVDHIDVEVDPVLDLIELEPLHVKKRAKCRTRLHGTYAVTVLQEAPQGDEVEFDIRVSFARRHRHPGCGHRWC